MAWAYGEDEEIPLLYIKSPPPPDWGIGWFSDFVFLVSILITIAIGLAVIGIIWIFVRGVINFVVGIFMSAAGEVAGDANAKGDEDRFRVVGHYGFVPQTKDHHFGFKAKPRGYPWFPNTSKKSSHTSSSSSTSRSSSSTTNGSSSTTPKSNKTSSENNPPAQRYHFSGEIWATPAPEKAPEPESDNSLFPIFRPDGYRERVWSISQQSSSSGGNGNTPVGGGLFRSLDPAHGHLGSTMPAAGSFLDSPGSYLRSRTPAQNLVPSFRFNPIPVAPMTPLVEDDNYHVRCYGIPKRNFNPEPIPPPPPPPPTYSSTAFRSTPVTVAHRIPTLDLTGAARKTSQAIAIKNRNVGMWREIDNNLSHDLGVPCPHDYSRRRYRVTSNWQWSQHKDWDRDRDSSFQRNYYDFYS